jgi:uncharacterized membrane protein (UPF0127 family)
MYPFLEWERNIIKNYKKNLVKIEGKNIILCNCYIADSFLKRFKGLMLTPPLEENEGLILTKTNSIHMFFMKYEIDVLFLDKDNIIIDKIISMKKRRVSKIYKNCNIVIELKSKALLNLDIKIGDKVIFTESYNE